MAVTKATLAKNLNERLGLSNRESHEFVEIFLSEIVEILESGKCVKLSGFGNFMLRDKGARPGRNPRTGEPVSIEPRRVVVFRPGQKLKGRVAFHGGGEEQEQFSTDP